MKIKVENLARKRIPNYGVISFLLIVLVNLTISANFLLNLKIDFFNKYYFPVIWVGFILLVDSLVYRFKGSSLIKNNFKDFAGLFLYSLVLWVVFEFTVNCIQEWSYVKLGDFSPVEYFVLSSIVFSFALPLIFETTDLVNALTSFKFKTKKFKLKNYFMYFLILIGVILFIIPIFKPNLAFPLIWVSLFLIFDPINCLNDFPSIIRSISESDWEIPVSLLVAGIVCGFFWGFWNYWSYSGWSNTVPFFDFYRTINISVFGYSLYLFFSWELFSMYHFIKSIGKSYLPRIINFIKRLYKK